ncbi:MAG: apolipoprotein N-acyltransferase [Bacteroidales bacterium]|nr:apolipoprotein N-acyltransferase [Bacteroidales bacterium]
MKTDRLLILLLSLFAVLMSVPFLVPHLGALTLVGFVPLLCAELVASRAGKKRFFIWYFAAFLAWNLATTWWVCKATVGGGLFASFFNALQMALVFWLFTLGRKHFNGALPYIFLAAAWIAWERWYMVSAEISWPWLTLGNAFARSTRLVQWYDITGVLGGSLWIWAVNLGVFALMTALSDGRWWNWTSKGRIAFATGLSLVLVGPVVFSEVRYCNYSEKSEAGSLDVCMAQSNFDPWQKLKSVSQREQTLQVTGLFEKAMQDYDGGAVLMMLPETFTSDVWLNDPWQSPTWKTLAAMLDKYRNANLLFGASTAEAFYQASRPDVLSRKLGDSGWYISRNTAFLFDNSGRVDLCHKNKLVVGSEMTPFPKLFVPLDDKLGGVMGRSKAQGFVKNLGFNEFDGDSLVRQIPLGVPICYESVYSEYCTEYIRNGAQALCVITNDGWWGNTPGYRQHFSYSSLRAIETRRDIARCANTGISALIDQRGDSLAQTGWWEPDYLKGSINLTDYKTFFVRYGDIVGRVCTFVFLLILLSLVVRILAKLK